MKTFLAPTSGWTQIQHERELNMFFRITNAVASWTRTEACDGLERPVEQRFGSFAEAIYFPMGAQ